MRKIHFKMAILVILSITLFQCGSRTEPQPAHPSITDFNPKSGYEGQTVTITGENFTRDVVVKFNDVIANVATVTPNSLTVTVPRGANTGEISVSVGNLMAISTSVFTVIPKPVEPTPLVISNVTPPIVFPGTLFTIEGQGFSTALDGNIIKVNGVQADVLSISSTSLTSRVPQGATTGKVTVTVGDRTATSPNDLTILSNANTWTKLVDFPGVARERATVFTTTYTGGSVCYVATGFNMNNSLLKDVWAYNSQTGFWSQKADFAGGARANAVGFSINGAGYIGLDGSISNNDLWMYDPSVNTWTRKADFPGTSTNKSVAFSANGKGYVLGDYNQLWEYNQANDTWTRKADFPGQGTKRMGAVSFVIGTKAYVGLGSSFASGLLGSRVDFYEYDTTTNTWTQKANYPLATHTDFTVGFAIGSKGYVGTGGLDTATSKAFYEYDPASNTWTRRADLMGDARNGAVGFSADGRGFILTGYTSGGYAKDFWSYRIQ